MKEATASTPRWGKTGKATQLSGLCPQTLIRMEKRGEIRAKRLNGGVRVWDLDSIRRFLGQD